MSIDSRNKRASALNSVPLVIFPVADGLIDNNDRQQMTWLYAGIVAGIPVVIVVISPAERTLIVRRQARNMIQLAEAREARIANGRRNVIVDASPRIVDVHSQRREIL